MAHDPRLTHGYDWIMLVGIIGAVIGYFWYQYILDHNKPPEE
jgi:hypothetical protein